MERKHIADRTGPRASIILSYRIVGFIKIHDFRLSWIFHGDPCDLGPREPGLEICRPLPRPPWKIHGKSKKKGSQFVKQWRFREAILSKKEFKKQKMSKYWKWIGYARRFILEIMDFNENHYSVRQKIGDPGPISIRNMFPLHPVTSKRPESPYGAKYFVLPENPVFQFFGL